MGTPAKSGNRVSYKTVRRLYEYSNIFKERNGNL